MSQRRFELTGVDPSAQLLEAARLYVDSGNLNNRTSLIEGVVDDLPLTTQFDAATALFVMHFLPDDGGKAAFLRSIRKRLRTGAPYLHVDVCFDDQTMFERLAPVYARHAVLGELAPEAAANVAARVGDLPVISEAALLKRLSEAGFEIVAPFFRGLWYAGWWLKAMA
jgi:tRNA (cmo5U34)-methyltransferase